MFHSWLPSEESKKSLVTFGETSRMPLDIQEEILNHPAYHPPPPVEPILVGPHNENILHIVVLSICFALVTVPLAGRLGARFASRRISIADYVLIFAYGLFVVNSVLCVRMTTTPGAFVHQWDVTMRVWIEYLHITFTWSNVSVVIITAVKIAILLEWIRIFAPRGARNAEFWASYALIWANAIFGVIMIIVLNTACYPFYYSWNRLLPGGCDHVSYGIDDLSAAIFSLVTDVLIFLVPQRAIWSMDMSSKRTRAGVVVTFAVGVLVIEAGVARIILAHLRRRSMDFTYGFSSVVLATTVEMAAAFLVTCIADVPDTFIGTAASKVMTSLGSWVSQRGLRSSDVDPLGRSEGSWETLMEEKHGLEDHE